jgi:hypothetical protein
MRRSILCELEHLFLGTQQDNVNDMRAKGRDTFGQNRGERNGWAILTEEKVRQIYGLLAAKQLSQEQIASRFGVDRGIIKQINRGTTWKHLMPENWEPSEGIGAPYGERAGAAKLVEDEVLQIRKLAWSGAYTLKEIGDMFGVSATNVLAIKQGRIWKHLWQEALTITPTKPPLMQRRV